MFWCRPTSCCKSTSTTCCSRSDSLLEPGSYLDLGRTSEYEEDLCEKSRKPWIVDEKNHPACPTRPSNRRDTGHPPEETKNRVQIKFIEKKKSKETGVPKILSSVESKPSTGLNNLAERAVSTLSNCISYILPAKAAKSDEKAINTEDKDRNTKNIQRKEADNTDAQDSKDQKGETTNSEVPEQDSNKFHKEEDNNIRRDSVKSQKKETIDTSVQEVDSKISTKQEAFEPKVDKSNSSIKKNKEAINSDVKKRHSKEIKPRNKSGKRTSSTQESRHIDKDKKQERMDDLIESFKTEALNVDDQMFDTLFEKLKKELDRLSCECQVKDTAIVVTDKRYKQELDENAKNIKKVAQVENVTGDTTPYTPSTEGCLTKTEWKDIFADLKQLLEKNSCGCNGCRSEDVTKAGNHTDVKLISSCMQDIKNECLCKSTKNLRSKSDTEIMNAKENDEGAISKELLEFYDKMISKLDEICQQCINNNQNMSNEGGRRKKRNISANDYEVNKSRNSSDNSLTSDSTINTSASYESQSDKQKMKRERKKNRKLKAGNKDLDKAVVTLSNREKAFENSVPLDDFVNLANELKEELRASSCKCTANSTELVQTKQIPSESIRLYGNENDLKLNQNAPIDLIQASDNNSASIVDPDQFSVTIALPHKLTLLERAAADPMSLSDLFASTTFCSQPVVESPAESFYSAECQTTNKGTEKNSRGEIGVNTQCKCFSDQFVQTLGDLKISSGVMCDGPLSLEDYGKPDMSMVQVRRKISQDGDVEKIKVRIRLEDEMEAVEPAGKVGIEKSQRFVNTFVDYGVKYETKEKTDDPKVVKDGSLIKIFIPLNVPELQMKRRSEDQEESKLSIVSLKK